MRIGVVLAGGAASQSPGSHSSDQWVPGGVHSAAVVVAADSGLDLARRLGIRPTLVVGDFDSVTRDALMWAAEEGIEMVPFPTDKDETDLDLAIGAALAEGIDRLIVLGGAGGRLDHLLGNIGAIVRAGQQVPTEAWLGTERVAVVTAERSAERAAEWSAELAAGTVVSVLPVAGDAVVSERGVRWPLDRHLLPLGSTQGVSNEAVGTPGEPVVVSVHEGCALVIVPAQEGPS